MSNGGVITLRFEDDEFDRLADAVAARLTSHAAEAWIGVQQAAEYLACPPKRIYNLVHQAAIPFHKDGSRLLFRRSELDAWLNRDFTRPG